MGFEMQAQSAEEAMSMHIVYDNNTEIVRSTHALEARLLLILGRAPGAKLEKQQSSVAKWPRLEIAPNSRPARNSRIRADRLYANFSDSSCAHHKFLKNH
jgi:hypothetical protein